MGTTSVAIIGGGAVGLATAWQLIERGITDVIVLEASELASGSSSRSAGFIETQYVDPLDIELRALSMLEFPRLRIGAELEIKEIGYLRLAPDREALEAFEASVASSTSWACWSRPFFSADDVRELVPSAPRPSDRRWAVGSPRWPDRRAGVLPDHGRQCRRSRRSDPDG